MRTLLPLTALLALACAGIPNPEENPDPVLTPPPVATEATPALRMFFLAHPEYADAARRERISFEACGLGTEAAHEWLTNPPPKTPAIVEVTTDAWEVFVAHSPNNCTSDDWSWYSNEASEASIARGAVSGYAGPNNDVVVVQRDGRELARIPVKEQGFLVARAGAEPKEIGYAPTSELMPELDAYFGAAK